MLIDRRIFNHFNYHLLLVTFAICATGLIVLFSAGYNPNSAGVPLGPWSYPVKSIPFAKQLAFMGVGVLVMLLGMAINNQTLYRVAYPIYIITLLLLVVVLFSGVVVNGSRRWFALGGLRFQPSELAKVAIILVMARYLSKSKLERGGFSLARLIPPGLLILMPMLLVMKQPDLGTALAIGGTGVGILLFVGVRPKALLAMLIAGLIAVVPLWYALHDYQKKRIMTLIDPSTDPLGSGYHLNQSKIAVGSGSFAGKGYLQGTQTQLEFLPEHTTDFVFSVLAEEWGFLGSVVLLGLYFSLLMLLFRVVGKSKDLFSAFIVVGITALFLFHIVVNIGMVIGLLPVVGITLPLFSYGGSSVLIFMFCIGVVLGISMRRYQFGQ